MKETEHHLLLVWLIFTGAVAFLFVVAWERDLLDLVFHADRSKLCVVIATLYVLGTCHCAFRTATLSDQLRRVAALQSELTGVSGKLSVDGAGIRIGQRRAARSWCSDYVSDLVRSRGREPAPNAGDEPNPGGNLLDTYISRVKGPHDIGWLAVDILIKLGLLGTIIGFILMLVPITKNTVFDISTLQKILQQMSSGMATALFTTLSGLLGSVLLGFQYHLLERGADQLIDRTVQLTEVEILPRLQVREHAS